MSVPRCSYLQCGRILSERALNKENGKTDFEMEVRPRSELGGGERERKTSRFFCYCKRICSFTVTKVDKFVNV